MTTIAFFSNVAFYCVMGLNHNQAFYISFLKNYLFAARCVNDRLILSSPITIVLSQYLKAIHILVSIVLLIDLYDIKNQWQKCKELISFNQDFLKLNLHPVSNVEH